MKATIRICKQCSYYVKKSENPYESYHYCSLHKDFFGENDLLMQVTPNANIEFIDDIPDDCIYLLEHTVNSFDA